MAEIERYTLFALSGSTILDGKGGTNLDGPLRRFEAEPESTQPSLLCQGIFIFGEESKVSKIKRLLRSAFAHHFH